MEKVTIYIPTGLSQEEEVLLIAKEFGKKYLPSPHPLIGNGYEIEALQTTIVVNRVPVVKTQVMYSCPICNALFASSSAKICYSSFGGITRKKRLCSTECRDEFISIAPDRITIKKPVYQFHGRKK